MNVMGMTTQDIWYNRELTAAQEASMLAAFGASWWYSYLPTQQDTVPTNGALFVPNFFDGSVVTAPNLATAATYPSRCILTTNEPYNPPPQASESVATVLGYWHQFELLTGCRLGSPSGGVGTGWDAWIAAFMAGAVTGTGLPPRVDFMVLHEYQSAGTAPTTAAANIINHVKATYDLYRRPIWITEMGLVSFGSPSIWASQSLQQQLAAAVIPALRSLPYVERIAPYPSVVTAGELATEPTLANAILADSSGVLTIVGQTYRDYGAHP